MYGILVSALNTALGFIFKQVVVKFVVLFAIYFVIAAFVNTLATFLGGNARCCSLSFDAGGLSQAMSNISEGMWFFMDLFSFSQGACMVVTAMTYRFLIRRIPFIG